MRSVVAAALAAVIGCSSAPPQTPSPDSTGSTPTHFRLLAQGGYGRQAGTTAPPRVAVATTAEEFERLWEEHIGGTAPVVDFNRESVIFLLLGTKSTGGYAINPESASIKGTEVAVEAPVTSPSEDSIVTMAFTSPYAVIAVPQPKIASAEWRGREGVVARGERPRV